MESFPPLPFLQDIRAKRRRLGKIRAKEDNMQTDYDDPDLGEFLAACSKRFCPWCGEPVAANRIGRKKKFCSDKCRWAFWKFETRHKDMKLEMEAKLNESS